MNDADLLGFGPAMRWIVGGSAVFRQRASASQMVQFETEVLATDDNVSTLAKLSGAWIERVRDRRPPKDEVFCEAASISPTYRASRLRLTTGTSAVAAITSYSCLATWGTWSGAASVPVKSTVPRACATFWCPWWNATRVGRFGFNSAVTPRSPLWV